MYSTSALPSASGSNSNILCSTTCVLSNMYRKREKMQNKVDYNDIISTQLIQILCIIIHTDFMTFSSKYTTQYYTKGAIYPCAPFIDLYICE